MLINFGSNIDDIKQAIAGTWSVSQDDGWRCVELGHIKLYKKMCKAGKTVLPSTFMKERTEVVGYMAFSKDDVTGGCITLQDQYIELKTNALVVIINM